MKIIFLPNDKILVRHWRKWYVSLDQHYTLFADFISTKTKEEK